MQSCEIAAIRIHRKYKHSPRAAVAICTVEQQRRRFNVARPYKTHSAAAFNRHYKAHKTHGRALAHRDILIRYLSYPTRNYD